MSAKGHTVAIDLGYHATRMAWINPETGRPELLPNVHGELHTPSVVYWDARAPLVGRAAEDRLDDPEAPVITGIRDLLGESFPLPVPGSPTPGQAAAALFRTLKVAVDARIAALEAVVLTHPAHWERSRVEALLAAATEAGFSSELLRTLPHPVAIARAYASGAKPVPQRMLVCDLGAEGTSLTVVERSADDYRIALPPSPPLAVGGQLADEILYRLAETQAEAELGRSLSTDDELDLRVLLECRRHRERLGVDPAAEWLVLPLMPTGDAIGTHRRWRVPFSARVGVTDLASELREPLRELAERVRLLLKDAGEQGQAVETVLLAGEAACLPGVVDVSTDVLGQAPVQIPSPESTAVLGALETAARSRFRPGLSHDLAKHSAPVSVASRILARAQVIEEAMEVAAQVQPGDPHSESLLELALLHAECGSSALARQQLSQAQKVLGDSWARQIERRIQIHLALDELKLADKAAKGASTQAEKVSALGQIAAHLIRAGREDEAQEYVHQMMDVAGDQRKWLKSQAIRRIALECASVSDYGLRMIRDLIVDHEIAGRGEISEFVFHQAMRCGVYDASSFLESLDGGSRILDQVVRHCLERGRLDVAQELAGPKERRSIVEKLIDTNQVQGAWEFIQSRYDTAEEIDLLRIGALRLLKKEKPLEARRFIRRALELEEGIDLRWLDAKEQRSQQRAQDRRKARAVRILAASGSPEDGLKAAGSIKDAEIRVDAMAEIARFRLYAGDRKGARDILDRLPARAAEGLPKTVEIAALLENNTLAIRALNSLDEDDRQDALESIAEVLAARGERATACELLVEYNAPLDLLLTWMPLDDALATIAERSLEAETLKKAVALLATQERFEEAVALIGRIEPADERVQSMDNALSDWIDIHVRGRCVIAFGPSADPVVKTEVRRLGEVFLIVGWPTLALEAARSIVDQDARKACLKDLAPDFTRMGWYDEAEEAIRLMPPSDRNDSLKFLGEFLVVDGLVDRALELNEGHVGRPEILAMAAGYLAERGEIDRTLAIARQAASPGERLHALCEAARVLRKSLEGQVPYCY